MPDPANDARRPYIVLAAVLLVVAVVSFRQAVLLDYDFHHFYRDASYVWQHQALNPDLDGADPRARRQLPFYLPVVALLLSPIAAGGVVPAAVVWTVLQVAALATCLRILGRWAETARGQPLSGLACVALATLAALPAILVAAQFNQLSFLVLALVLAAVAALERGKAMRAGVLFGSATVLKLLPAVFLVWLLLKRQWSAAASLVLTVLVVALLPCLAVFGPADTARYHKQWWDHNVRGAPARGMADPSLREHFIDHRNQSVAAVVNRVFGRDHRYAVPVNFPVLSERACGRVAAGLWLALAAGMIWTTRRPQRALREFRLRGEAACYVLAMLVFSPLFRQYYLVWALPALVLLLRMSGGLEAGGARAAARTAVVLWIIGMVAWMSETARAYGVHLLMSIAIAALLLAVAARVDRERTDSADEDRQRSAPPPENAKA